MIAPYGSWPSILSAEAVAEASPRLEGARLVEGADGREEVWWAQSLPAEGGRTGIRRWRAGEPVDDMLPAPWNARSRVHEYGGGAWDVAGDDTVVWVEKTDQRVWARRPGADPTPLTPAEGGMRFGGLLARPGVIWAVRETHAGVGPAHRDLVTIPTDGSAATDPRRIRSVAADSDFVAQPAVSPSGEKVAWLAWNHPDMPWDRTSLRLATLAEGRLVDEEEIAGGRDRAPLQPAWTPDGGELLFLDDPTGRWNLHRWRAGDGARCLAPADADTGGPLWNLGTRWFAPLGDGGAVCVRTHGGDRLVRVAPDGAVIDLGGPVTAGASVEDARGMRALVSGSTAEGASGLWLVDVADTPRWYEVTVTAPPAPPAWIPRAEPIVATGPQGDIHAFVYPPTHPDARGPEGERAPYLVLVHGGPTAHVGGAPTAKTAYFTSRGIGVLEVNYSGSSGYGRDYRERLRGQWGVADVADVAAAAQYLVRTGRADPARVAIEGGSAGGWTVLAAIARTDVFAAGISRYGVGDARALAADTHDFEARYLDGLIGPLPDAEPLYLERSPLSHIEGFTVPLLLLQGADDLVVPPAQGLAIRDALRAQGVPHAWVLYEGEGHGFRRAETLVDVLEKTLGFLGAVFGFVAADVEPLTLTSEGTQEAADADE